MGIYKESNDLSDFREALEGEMLPFGSLSYGRHVASVPCAVSSNFTNLFLVYKLSHI
jgi:hypothetical protein